ncbi:Sarcoma antigen 1 [Plecturocebus cupreus]
MHLTQNFISSFPDATVTHNVRLINMAAAGISSITIRNQCKFVYYLCCLTWFPYLMHFIWFPDATITHNVQEGKINNGQPAPDNILSTVTPGLINLAGDQYATFTHNVH